MYFSSSTLYMYLIQIFRSISSILSLEAINLYPFSYDITSAILVSQTNPVGFFLCKHFLLFTTWVKTLNSGEAQNMEQSKTNQNKYIYSESTESNGNSYQMWLILCHLSQTVERQSCAEHWDHTVKPQMLRIHWRISTYKGGEDKGQTPWKNCYTSIVHNVHMWKRVLIFIFHCKNYTQQHHQRHKILSLNNDNIK